MTDRSTHDERSNDGESSPTSEAEVEVEAKTSSTPGDDVAASSGGPGLSRRSALAALGAIGLAGLGSGAASASGDHFGETWTGADSEGLSIINQETSGQPVGLYAEIPATEGYGLYTPDDVYLGGAASSLGVWKVSTHHYLGEDEGGNVIQGHPSNGFAGTVSKEEITGGTIAGGGSVTDGTNTTNTIAANYVAIGGGEGNHAGHEGAGSHSTIGGGQLNHPRNHGDTIGGGIRNVTEEEGRASTIGGGENNRVLERNRHITVAGGLENAARGHESTISGGGDNNTGGRGATVGGGGSNLAKTRHSTVGGGKNNRAIGEAATVGGGMDNETGDDRATVGGGDSNISSGEYATVAGGDGNTADGVGATVAGGEENTAEAGGATVAGGKDNAAEGESATVAGGKNNIAGQALATVGGGRDNDATEVDATVGGGRDNDAAGIGATIPGGRDNEASGTDSFAAGHGAAAEHDGTFVWSDSASGNYSSTGEDQFLIDADGGVGIGTNSPEKPLHVRPETTTIGFVLQNSGDGDGTDDGGWGMGTGHNTDRLNFYWNDDVASNWGTPVASINTDGEFSTNSDARLKRDVRALEGVLDDVLSLRPTRYRFEGDDDKPLSFGFLAQEVRELFPEIVREADDDRGTLSLCYDQFAALTVQAIKEQQDLIDERDEQVEELETAVEDLEAENDELRERLRALESKVGASPAVADGGSTGTGDD